MTRGQFERARRSIAAAGALASLSTGTLATAQTSTDGATRAAALFDDAKTMMEKGDFAQACPRLAESQALDPQVGTMLNLASCYEAMDKTASACAAWRDATAAAAQKVQADREMLASEHAQAVCPRAPQVTVRIADQSAKSGLDVTLNGARIPMERWGTASPLDPGEYEVRATAPGYRPYAARFVVVDEQAPVLTVPELALEATPPPANAAPAARRPAGTGMSGHPVPATAWVAGGIGAVALGAAAAFGVAATAAQAESNRNGNCVDANDNCNRAGTEDRHRATAYGFVSDVTLGLGLSAVATGVVLWLAASSAPRTGPSVNASVSAGGCSLSVVEAW